jgi:hypothetical protein
MLSFVSELRHRNDLLYFFGLICLFSSVVFLLLSATTSVKVYNVSAWYKPFKFAFSTFLYSWAMAWYCHYLQSFNTTLFSWSVIVLLGFEILYIALQAGRGQLSHYNVSTPVYSALYSLMAFAATAVTLYTAYIGILFFRQSFGELPDAYIWAIRLSIVLFVVFSLEGFVMGSKLTHTIGGPDGEAGIPVLNWSTRYGDPRIAHFIGMHALQLLPFLGYYVIRNTKGIIVISVIYGLLAVFALVQALKGRPFFRRSVTDTQQQQTR